MSAAAMGVLAVSLFTVFAITASIVDRDTTRRRLLGHVILRASINAFLSRAVAFITKVGVPAVRVIPLQASADRVDNLATTVPMSPSAAVRYRGGEQAVRCPTGFEVPAAARAKILASAALGAADAAFAAILRIPRRGRACVGSGFARLWPLGSGRKQQIHMARILHRCRPGFHLAGEGSRPALPGLHLHPLVRGAEGRQHVRIYPVLPLPPSCPCLFRRLHPGRREAALRGKSQEFGPEDLVATTTSTPFTDKRS